MKVTKNSYQLLTNRLFLLPVEDSDIENIYRGLSHPKVIKHYGVSFKTLEETKEQMEWYRQLRENETGFWWKILLKDSEEFVGAIGLNDIKKEHQRGEIGFWLLPEFWGIGIAVEALPKVLSYGFKQLNLHRVEAWVDSQNESSRKVLEKTGFHFEGTLKDYELKNNEFINMDILARIVDNTV